MKRGEDGEKWSERAKRASHQTTTNNKHGGWGGGQHTSLAVE